MIISVIVYLSAFSLVVRMLLTGRKKSKAAPAKAAAAAAENETVKGGEDA